MKARFVLVINLILGLALLLGLVPAGMRFTAAMTSAGPAGQVAGVHLEGQLSSARIIVVTSRTDSGEGSLRRALLSATTGDTIIFEPVVFPPTSPMTITLLSALPEINHGNLTIDASNAGVVLDGRYTSSGSDGLRITSDGNVIKGLQIIRFPDDGVEITDGAKHNTIGGDWTVGSAPHGEGNVITLNGGDGVDINGTGTLGNTITRNSIHSNGGIGIDNCDGGNAELSPPALTNVTANSVGGLAPVSYATVEIFSDDADEGRVYEGTTTAGAGGSFIFTKATGFHGPYLTATATDSGGNTSEFSSPVAKPGPTPTPTPTPTPSTPTPTYTPTPTPSPIDPYEPDDTCAQANDITTDGVPQSHTFHREADEDWGKFTATAGTTYVVETANAGPQADTVLALFDACDHDPLASDDNAFGTTARLVWTCSTGGIYYLQVTNQDPDQYGPDATYDLSVRAQTPGAAAVIVAGHNDAWTLQSNIDYCTNTAYRSFLLAGVPESKLYYLNPNPSLQDPDDDDVYDDVDAVSTAANLQYALETWATGQVGAGDQLFVYLMDHGAVDAFATDGEGDVTTPQMFNTWLITVENTTGCLVNVIIEACHAGSFIDQVPDVAEEISEPGRVVIASTGREQNAYASPQGAYFSDAFWTSIRNSSNLWVAFQDAVAAVEATGLWQTPWLDDNGDATPNDATDGQVAPGRGLVNFFGGRPPVVDAVTVTLTTGDEGVIQAAVRDDYGVGAVWAVVVPPSFEEPPPGEPFEWPDLGLPKVELLKDGGLYQRTYSGFDEAGVYRAIVYARDRDGNQSVPAAGLVRTGYAVYLPLILK